MSVAGVVVLIAGLLTAAILIILILALVRHLKLLASTVRSFERELRPVLEGIRSEALTAQRRLDRMAQRRRDGGPGRTPGARLPT